MVTAIVIMHFFNDILQAISFPYNLLPDNSYLRGFIWRLILYSPILLLSGLLFWDKIPQLISIRNAPLKAMILALLFTLPMFLSFPYFFEFNTTFNAFSIYDAALLPAIFEEIIFRGLIFGILYKFCRWSFIPAVLLPAIIFGLGHLYQTVDIVGAIFTFLITFIGAIWFSWLYVKWNYNILLPIFLHFLMNLSWVLFNFNDGAAGNTFANIGRLATIIISLIITLRYAGGKQNLSWKNFRVYSL